MLPSNVKAKYCGTIDHENVFDVLSNYDAFLFPTLSENFGHVISEALFAGCPAIISNTTPWLGLEKSGAGWDLDLTDRESFINAINSVIQYDEKLEMEARKNAQEHAYKAFDIKNMKEAYIRALTV